MLNAFKNLFTSKITNKTPLKKGIHRRLELLGLEERVVPATFTVVNNSDSGAGSLRQAIIDANTTAGNDIINFNFATGGNLSISGVTVSGANITSGNGGAFNNSGTLTVSNSTISGNTVSRGSGFIVSGGFGGGGGSQRLV